MLGLTNDLKVIQERQLQTLTNTPTFLELLTYFNSFQRRFPLVTPLYAERIDQQQYPEAPGHSPLKLNQHCPEIPR